MTIQVVLADDHAVVRDGLRLLLTAETDISVIGEATNGLEAVQQVQSLQPHVVVMDIGMPELNGIDATSLIRAASAATQVVILSMHASAEHIVRALQAGALGYLLKESAGREVVAAVRSVHTQRRYVSEQISATMIDDYLTQLRNPQSLSPLASLSRREREVLQLVAEGHSSADIGRRLSLSPKTIETYRSRLMKKLGLEDIPSLVKFAVYHGLTPSP
jgi:DNA-binding NarL/FixJ family response regulator